MMNSHNSPLIKQVQPPKDGRRLAVGDIHGCLETLRHLLEVQIGVEASDQLFFLGDYIDRGPNSSGVIDYILKLLDRGFEVYALKGNHEEMFLDAYSEYCLMKGKPRYMQRMYAYYNAEDLFGAGGLPVNRYLAFMNGLYYCIDVGDGYLVHANLSPGPSMLLDAKAMLWARNTALRAEDLNGKWVVHGHTPMDIRMIRKLAKSRHFRISIDNGCVYHGKPRRRNALDLGRLCALDLDSFQLYEAEYRG